MGITSRFKNELLGRSGSQQWKMCCGMTNSCGGKCNCDKNDEAWREDSGFLTDKNTLPVTELRFGDTGLSYMRKDIIHWENYDAGVNVEV